MRRRRWPHCYRCRFHLSHNFRFAFRHYSPRSMISQGAIRLRGTLLAAPALIAALAAGTLVPLADAHGDLNLFVGAFLALATVSALFAIPIRLLPGIALLVALLVPTELSSLPHELQGASLGVVPLAVWLIRGTRSRRIPAGLRVLASLLGAWLLLSLAFAPLRTNKGMEWLF